VPACARGAGERGRGAARARGGLRPRDRRSVGRQSHPVQAPDRAGDGAPTHAALAFRCRDHFDPIYS